MKNLTLLVYECMSLVSAMTPNSMQGNTGDQNSRTICRQLRVSRCKRPSRGLNAVFLVAVSVLSQTFVVSESVHGPTMITSTQTPSVPAGHPWANRYNVNSDPILSAEHPWANHDNVHLDPIRSRRASMNQP